MNIIDNKNNVNGIVILNYKTKELTISLVNTIKSFDLINYICVVDNNSGDNFDGVFTEKEYDKVKFIESDVNVGYSAGNNIGLKYLINDCKCDTIFIANPDVTFNNDAIFNINRVMNEDPKLAIVSTKRYGSNNELIHQYFNFPKFSNSLRKCFFWGRKRYDQENNIEQNYEIDNSNGIKYVDAVPGAFFAIKKEFLLKNNYLYEGVFLYGEEIILGMQAKLLGYNAAIINSNKYYHNHIRERFSNRKMFWYDRKSLIHYYQMFNILSFFKLRILFLTAILGTIEYNLAFIIYKMFSTMHIRRNK